MKRMILALILAVMTVVGTVHAERTHKDGRIWRTWTLDEKVMFVVGYGDGTVMGAWIANSPSVEAHSDNLIPQQLTYGEIIEAVDAFYENPLNRPISIGMALLHVSQKAHGVAANKIEADIADSRRSAGNRYAKENK
jgi:hypothetical protein